MKLSLIILYISAAALFAGCTATAVYLNDGKEKFPSTNAESIKIYSERELGIETIEIGYVSVHITDGATGDAMKETLKKRAAEIGADAVVDFHILGPTAEGIAVKYKAAADK